MTKCNSLSIGGRDIERGLPQSPEDGSLQLPRPRRNFMYSSRGQSIERTRPKLPSFGVQYSDSTAEIRGLPRAPPPPPRRVKDQSISLPKPPRPFRDQPDLPSFDESVYLAAQANPYQFQNMVASNAEVHSNPALSNECETHM